MSEKNKNKKDATSNVLGLEYMRLKHQERSKLFPEVTPQAVEIN